MSLSIDFKNDLKLLASLNPNEKSVAFTEKGLASIGKRSCFYNLFRWFINIISCSKIPRNPSLDKVTLHVFENAKKIELNLCTNDEKDLYEHAITNLNKIIEENGGRKDSEIKELLESVNKIENLETVRQLNQEKEETKDIAEEVPVNPNIPIEEDKDPANSSGCFCISQEKIQAQLRDHFPQASSHYQKFKKFSELFNLIDKCEDENLKWKVIDHIYEQLERHPWHLLLHLNCWRLDGIEFEDHIEKYTICKKILNTYANEYIHDSCNLNYFDEESSHTLAGKLKEFFSLARDNQFEQALEIFKNLNSWDQFDENELQGYLLQVTRACTPEVLCEELPYLNEGQLLVALLDPLSNSNMRQAITEGWKKGKLSEETLACITKFALKMQETFNQDPQKTLLSDFLNTTIFLTM